MADEVGGVQQLVFPAHRFDGGYLTGRAGEQHGPPDGQVCPDRTENACRIAADILGAAHPVPSRGVFRPQVDHAHRFFKSRAVDRAAHSKDDVGQQRERTAGGTDHADVSRRFEGIGPAAVRRFILRLSERAYRLAAAAADAFCLVNAGIGKTPVRRERDRPRRADRRASAAAAALFFCLE